MNMVRNAKSHHNPNQLLSALPLPNPVMMYLCS
jgi:hypothetical protein